MSRYNEALMQYLTKTDPDDWHKIALGWNWDNGHQPLAWIAQQAECDKGTALLIYWQGGAIWLQQYDRREDVPTWEVDAYDLVRDIEARYIAGFYTRQKIAFDPRDDKGSDWTRSAPDLMVKHPIPPILYEPTSGHVIEDIYPEEGYPPDVIAAVERL